MNNAEHPWPWLIGSDGPPTREPLSTGRLTAVLSGLELFDVRLDGEEVMRRLAVRIRDPAWGTVAPGGDNVRVALGEAGFTVDMSARNRGEDIDVAWQATVSAADEALTVDLSVTAIADSRHARIGIVSLHPLTFAGCAFRARRKGASEAGRLPALVGPQIIENGVEWPLFPAFDRLEIDLPGGRTARIEFEGDLFELEDQRNWADGSFKIYSTPLATPVPMTLRKGETIRQRMRLSFSGGGTRTPLPARTGDGPVVLSCGEANGRTLPPVGVLLDSDGHLFDDREAALLRALALPHLHAEVLAEEPGGARAIAHAGAAAEAIGAPLALALVFPPGVADIAPALSSLKPAIDSVRLARLMLLPEGEAVTPDAWLAEGQRVFGGGLPLAIGTRGDFVALNRVRPQPPEGVGLVYAVNPQVHDSDIDALVQSPEGQADAVRTALSFAPGAPLHVGPLTLKPRPLSLAAAGDAAPADADPRQATCLAAAWLASSVKHLAEAGAASVTAFEATGRRGVVGRVADMAVHRSILVGVRRALSRFPCSRCPLAVPGRTAHRLPIERCVLPGAGDGSRPWRGSDGVVVCAGRASPARHRPCCR